MPLPFDGLLLGIALSLGLTPFPIRPALGAHGDRTFCTMLELFIDSDSNLVRWTKVDQMKSSLDLLSVVTGALVADIVWLK